MPSLLFPPEDASPPLAEQPPDYFGDLNLDQIVAAVIAGRKAYRLTAFYHTPLHTVEAVRYRQAVARDLEMPALRAAVAKFSEDIQQVQRYLHMLEHDLEYHHHRAGWQLAAAARYVQAVEALRAALEDAELHAAALQAFREALRAYTTSEDFTALASDTAQMQAELAAIRYCVLIQGDSVRVRRCHDEPNHAEEIEQTFAKFRQGEVKDYRTPFYIRSGMNHVEAQILDCVVKLFPEPFARLDDYCARHGGFLNPELATFAREAQFFLAYQDYIAPLREAGLPFCYPEVTTEKRTAAHDACDLALAHKLVQNGQPVVLNDFRLEGKERILVVTGPNQGGKTTFARTFGQLHHLAALGLPVPAREATLYLPDRIFTHFERAEDVASLRGKLEDELVRLHDILVTATDRSLLIMNEVFASTSFHDALFLGRKAMETIVARGLMAVFVTFLSELANWGEETVSMVSTVDPEHPEKRTYKIVRKPADGLAYALALAEKHRLTYAQLRARLKEKVE